MLEGEHEKDAQDHVDQKGDEGGFQRLFTILEWKKGRVDDPDHRESPEA